MRTKIGRRDRTLAMQVFRVCVCVCIKSSSDGIYWSPRDVMRERVSRTGTLPNENIV